MSESCNSHEEYELPQNRKKSRGFITNLRELKRRHSNLNSFESPCHEDPNEFGKKHTIRLPGAPKPARRSDYAPQTAIMPDSSRNMPTRSYKSSLMRRKSMLENAAMPNSSLENPTTPPKSKRVSIIPPILSSKQTFGGNHSSVRYAGAPRLSLVDVHDLHDSPEPLSEDSIEPRIVKSVAERNKPRGSITTIEPLKCRICFMEQGEESDDEPLISPCRCKGTMGLLHSSCLQEWLVTAHTTKCELCGYQYILKSPKFRRNTVVQHASSLRLWLSSKISQRNIIGDTICTVLLAVGTAIMTYLCIYGIIHFRSVNPYAWQVFGLIALATSMILCFLCWTVVAFRHHWNEYQDARRRRLEMVQLQQQKDLSTQLRHCTILPRPRGSSQLLVKHNEDEEPFGAIKVGLLTRRDMLEPVEEVSELTRSFISTQTSENQNNCCSPSHHTKHNISIKSTDIIL